MKLVLLFFFAGKINKQIIFSFPKIIFNQTIREKHLTVLEKFLLYKVSH